MSIFEFIFFIGLSLGGRESAFEYSRIYAHFFKTNSNRWKKKLKGRRKKKKAEKFDKKKPIVVVARQIIRFDGKI